MRKITDNPYPGKRAFREHDHDHFCGRGADVAAIAEFWTANRLTVVTGPVASGKTSLLNAGVYPAMRENRADPLPPGSLTQGMMFPFAILPEHNPYAYSLLSSWSPAEVPTRLAGLTISEFVRQWTASRPDHRIFAAIDQFDDIAVDPSAGSRRSWREQFLADLARACRDNPSLHLLVVARAEARDIIAKWLGIGVRYEVRPLSVPSAVEAVAEPAARAGRPFEASAAQQLVEDLRTSRVITVRREDRVQAGQVEPALLQAACGRFWDTLPDALPHGDEITKWAVRELSDTDGALSAYCADAITKVAIESNLPAQHLQAWVISTFVAKGGAEEGPVSTAGMPNSVARALADQHLLAREPVEQRRSARWYRLLSDRLIEPLRHASIGRPGPPPTAADYLRAATRQLALGEVGLARRHAELSLRRPPSLRVQAEAESLLANMDYEEGAQAKALDHYREASALLDAAGDTGAAIRSQVAVGQVLLLLGRTREAVAELRAAVDRVPNDMVLHTQLALALWQLGESPAALAILSTVLAIDGGNRDALRIRGEIHADLGDARNAILDLERQSVVDRPSAQAAHGLALAELGRYSAAAREIEAAVETAPQNGRVLLYAARALALTGDEVRSWDLAIRAVDANDPPLSPSHRNLALKLTGDE